MSYYSEFARRYPTINAELAGAYDVAASMSEDTARAVYAEFSENVGKAKRDVDTAIKIHEAYPDNFSAEDKAGALQARADLLTVVRAVARATHEGEAIFEEAKENLASMSSKAAAVQGLSNFYASAIPQASYRATDVLPVGGRMVVGALPLVPILVAATVIVVATGVVLSLMQVTEQYRVSAEREKARMDAGYSPDLPEGEGLPWYVPAAGVTVLTAGAAAVAYSFLK